MFHSNIRIGSAINLQRALGHLHANIRKAFYYSPEDKFVETQKAADELEALCEQEGKDVQDLADTEPRAPNFTFWI